MTEPLPCPFCGHVGVTHSEGSTFRWMVTECDRCGAQCGEERINTMTMERSAAIEQAKEAAIKTWNTRAALEQQAEPPPEWESIKNILDEYGLDAIAFVAEFKAAQRPWVDLTDGDWEWVADRKGTSLDTFEQGATWAAYKLERRNT